MCPVNFQARCSASFHIPFFPLAENISKLKAERSRDGAATAPPSRFHREWSRTNRKNPEGFNLQSNVNILWISFKCHNVQVVLLRGMGRLSKLTIHFTMIHRNRNVQWKL